MTGSVRRRLVAVLLTVFLVLPLTSCALARGIAEELRDGDARERAGELIPRFGDRYFLSALDDHRLGAVCDIYEAAMAFERSCDLDGVSSEELSQVFSLMFAECPELYQLDNTGAIKGYTNALTGKFVSVELSYLMDREEYEESRRACEEVLAGFVRDTAGMGPEEREKYVFDALAVSCRYDVEAKYAGTARGALLEGKAKCDGVSAAMKWAMEELDIPCVTLTADIVGGVVGHAWNAVELGGEWYRVDLTQSTRIDEFVEAGLEDVIYFALNISDDFVSERYEVLDVFASVRQVPECRTMDRSWFAVHDLFIRDGEDEKRILERELEKNSGAGGGSFTVQFENVGDYEAFPQELGELISDFYGARGLRYKRWSCRSLPYNVCVVTVEE